MNRLHVSRRLWILLVAVVCCSSAALWSLRTTVAQEAAAEAEAAEATDAALEIPEGDAAEIAAFIEKLAGTEPEGDTQEEQIAYTIKILRVINEASAKMLDAEPTDEQSMMAESYRLMALQGLNQLGTDADAAAFATAIETAMASPRVEIAAIGWKSYVQAKLGTWDTLDDAGKKEFETALDRAMGDERPEVASIGWQGYIYSKLTGWDALDDAAKKAMHDRIVAKVNGEKLSSLDVSIVAMVAQQLDRTDDAFVATLLTDTLPAFKKSADEEVKAALDEANLEGFQRRLTLMGNPMELTGELLGGGEIDWKSYRGKVVLVDFSATWCGPCVQEAPNVLNMYSLYKDKGFDVVAISLDRTPEAAEQYVKDNGIKWATLFPSKEEDRYWNHPLAKYYGITGIPTAILVDQKGNAVHMNARGPLLQAELERLLGPPAEADAAEDKG